ncbi:MAG: GNAT family N-acetyltransferase [Planctomycetaceae bacterium]
MLPATMGVHSEQRQDHPGIHALLVDCFPTDAEARLVAALRDAGRLTISLVARADDRIVGYVAFSPVTVESGETGIGLAPVAVPADYRQRGIATELIRAGLAYCEAMEFGWTVVLGDPAYYGRFGYRAASSFGLSDSYGGGDAFQVLELRPEAAPRGAGLVQYAREFEIFS